MITKTDIAMLLLELKDKGEDVSNYLKSLYSSSSIPLGTIKFLNDKRNFDIANFYEKLRKSYNNKRSDLYINIVKELDNPEDILTTLASYNLQALLYSKNIKDKEMFYRNSRLEELNKVLISYYSTYDIEPCIELLSLIKADIKLFEGL